MSRTRISSGSPFEPTIGFSRAVRVGDRVLVSGTGPVFPDGSCPADAAAQARRCLEIIETALAEAGASPADVVRTRVLLTDVADADAVSAVHGEIYDVVLDIRVGSPTFGKWTGLTLSDENGRQLYVPAGFAHGFCVLSPTADVVYKCSDLYRPEDNYGILWSDPDLAIDWPVDQPIVSERDAALPRLKDVPETNLPKYE